MHKSIVKIRSMLLVFLTHHMALPLLRMIRKPPRFPYASESLRQMPAGTLGKQLIEIDKKGLKLLPYYAKHDIKHILLQYDTTDEGEVCLQCFMLGNRHLSFPVVATVVYGYLTMPEHWGNFRDAYYRGSGCKPIEGWQWFTLLEQPIHVLIKKIIED